MLIVVVRNKLIILILCFIIKDHLSHSELHIGGCFIEQDELS